MRDRCVKRLVCSFPTVPGATEITQLLEEGAIDLELVPQGVLTERLRAAAAGVTGFYLPAPVGTLFHDQAATREIDGVPSQFYEPLPGDVAFIKADVADTNGNVQCRLAARNFNPVMARAARVTVLETESRCTARTAFLGMGSEVADDEHDPDLVNAGKQYVSVVPGAAITDQVESFTIARRGLLDIAVLGVYQVSSAGDLANWKRPGQVLAGVGGAVDIAAGPNEVWVMMKARARDGSPKLVTECTYPLSAQGAVTRVYTELGVPEPRGDHFAATRVPTGAHDSDLTDISAAPLVLAIS